MTLAEQYKEDSSQAKPVAMTQDASLWFQIFADGSVFEEYIREAYTAEQILSTRKDFQDATNVEMTAIVARIHSRLEARARRIAKKHDCFITKSRERTQHSNNKGGFQIVDAYRNTVISGVNYDMTPEEIIEFFQEQDKAEASA
jgi:hypothetical protein